MTISSFSSTSQGADWKIFYQVREYDLKGDASLNYYYDNESVVKPLKDFVQVWFKTTLGKDSSDNLVGKDGSDEAEQYRGHVEINCKSKSYRLLEETQLDSVETEHEAQKSSPPGKAFRRVPLGSAMGTLWSNLCGYYY
jgi:hypothetical protein